ncbi:arabinose ABC transporter substrate-binding protein [Clostridium sediminicola]|uniref:substrate-binding domain-containing protein n=1 Tax=Clostridium sediminicola TaxID=3114879 RepID=UPI0031F22ED1
MKKIIGLVMSCVLIAGLFVGCTSNNSTNKSKSSNTAEESSKDKGDDKIVIAAIYKALDQVWFQDEGAAAEKAAKALGADEVLLIDAKMNPDTYLTALDNVITQQVDGILVCPPDQKLSAATIQKCEAADIPVIACDDALQDENGNFLAPFVGIDAKQIGRDMAAWLSDYVEAEGKIKDMKTTGLLLMTVDTVSSCLPRTEGQLEVWKEKQPDFLEENIFRADYNGETAKGFDAAAAVLTSHPEIKTWLVMGVNDEGCAGATRALEQQNLDKDAVVVGLGGYLAKGEFDKDYSCFVSSAFIDANDIGTTSATELMENILNDKEIPMDYRIKAKMVTADNYKDIMGDAAN